MIGLGLILLFAQCVLRLARPKLFKAFFPLHLGVPSEARRIYPSANLPHNCLPDPATYIQ
jgi:hypothetical protein